jgi:hypothetical protein
MDNISRFTSAFFRTVIIAPLFVILPIASCGNSTSSGRTSDGGSAGAGGAITGAGGGQSASGGSQSGMGGADVGGTNSGTGGAGTGGTKVGTGGAGAGGATSGAGGTTAADAGKPDAQVSLDASDLASLCTTTGGQISSGLCCGSASDFPDSCLTGACGCSPTSSHTVAKCSCPNDGCFSTRTGCGNGTLDAGRDGNVVCGGKTCTAGEYCCNALTSTCAQAGMSCIQ